MTRTQVAKKKKTAIMISKQKMDANDKHYAGKKTKNREPTTTHLPVLQEEDMTG